ncbi:bifunctional transcriptional activator/DNA repair enzyme AdaA [Aliikangiella maris]|uniref:Methylated-DNA--[protein]-cysteine S-methyltransferase n=2 Tax=Aliikangiella maris TaxID=3162458 RepID=A0ABV3MUM1_9GAMM
MTISLPQVKTMYRAVVNKDSRFEGIFVFAVKTTGIFCRPTCRAKTPKMVNVEYFATAKQAVAQGFRPCKICQPTKSAGEIPDWIKPLLEQIKLSTSTEQPNLRLTDESIQKMGIDPARVRRWFKQNYGVTFQCYLREQRLDFAAQKITNRAQVTSTAFESGYESLSGFHQAFKKQFGQSPGTNQFQHTITIAYLPTPLGVMIAGTSEQGICLLEFADRIRLQIQIERLAKLFKSRFVLGTHPFIEQLSTELHQYFCGQQKRFSVPLDLPGTVFQREVWQALIDVPYGQSRSYQQQAAVIERPKAVRAVAKANADNRIAIVIPCHRILGKDGKLTGYAGGLWRKQRLLELEAGKIKLISS